MRFITTDPRSGGLAAAIGSTVFFITGGSMIALIKVTATDTAWVTATNIEALSPADLRTTPPVSVDPRTGAGRTGAVGSTVLYYTGGNGTYLHKYGTGATDWTEFPAGGAGPTGPAGPPGPSSDTTASNVGAGAEVFQTKTGDDLAFRSFIGTRNIVVTQNTNDITIEGPDLTGINQGWFGDASDGSHLLVPGVAIASPALSVSTTTIRGVVSTFHFPTGGRDLYFDDLEVPAGHYLFSNSLRIFVRGTLYLHGYIGCWGDDGLVGQNIPGAGGSSAARGAQTLGGSGSGGGGGGTSTGVGIAGGNVGACPPEYVNGVLGVGRGGQGGRNHSGSLAAAAGTVSPSAYSLGNLRNILQASTGRTLASNIYNGGSGGSGGRGESVSAPLGGGGGAGAGGGCVVVCARKIVGSGAIVAFGGNGGAGNPAGNGGGGGGGGGGWVSVVIGTGSFPATDVLGGVGGAKGLGASAAGGDGGVGLSFLFRVGA